VVDAFFKKVYCMTRGTLQVSARKVDVRLPERGNSNSHGARPAHPIITMITCIRTIRVSIKNFLSQVSARDDRNWTSLLLASQVLCARTDAFLICGEGKPHRLGETDTQNRTDWGTKRHINPHRLGNRNWTALLLASQVLFEVVFFGVRGLGYGVWG